MPQETQVGKVNKKAFEQLEYVRRKLHISPEVMQLILAMMVLHGALALAVAAFTIAKEKLGEKKEN
jgi:hypothetical protein